MNDDEKNDGAELAAGANDTGTSQTETARDRIIEKGRNWCEFTHHHGSSDAALRAAGEALAILQERLRDHIKGTANYVAAKHIVQNLQAELGANVGASVLLGSPDSESVARVVGLPPVQSETPTVTASGGAVTVVCNPTLDALSALSMKWRDPEWWKEYGATWDSRDCAEELDSLLVGSQATVVLSEASGSAQSAAPRSHSQSALRDAKERKA